MSKKTKSPHLSVAATREQIDTWTEAAKLDDRKLSSAVRVVLDKWAARRLAQVRS